MSAVIDHKGLLGVRTVRMSKAKLTALLVSFGGAVMTAVEDLIAADDQVGGVDSAKLLLYWAVTLAVGCALPIQAALNWRLGERLRSKFRAAVVSFGAGLAVLVCALTVHGAGNSLWPNFGETQWWQYVGGLLGVVFVMSGIAFAGRIGGTMQLRKGRCLPIETTDSGCIHSYSVLHLRNSRPTHRVTGARLSRCFWFRPKATHCTSNDGHCVCCAGDRCSRTDQTYCQPQCVGT